MAIIAVITGKGITKDMYETLRQEVKWESDRPDGLMVHTAGFDEAGDAHVVDVWESKEKMDAFFGSRLIPVMEKNGIPAPSMETYSAHNVNIFEKQLA